MLIYRVYTETLNTVHAHITWKSKQDVQTKLKHFEQKKQKAKQRKKNLYQELHPETSAVTLYIQKHWLSHSASKNISCHTLRPKTSSHSLCMIRKHQLSYSASRNFSFLTLHPKTPVYSASKNISSLCIQKHQLTLCPETSVLSLSIQKHQFSRSASKNVRCLPPSCTGIICAKHYLSIQMNRN